MHTIRLRGPWERQPLAGDAPIVRHARRFHRPTNLAPGQRVWLVIDETPGLVGVTLNGTPIGQASRASPLPCPARLEIAALLAPQNVLILDRADSGDSGSIEASPSQVRLEIENPT